MSGNYVLPHPPPLNWSSDRPPPPPAPPPPFASAVLQLEVSDRMGNLLLAIVSTSAGLDCAGHGGWMDGWMRASWFPQ